MTVLTKFGESLGGKLAERWLTTTGTAPFSFAVAGLAAWLVREGPVAGWSGLEAWLAEVPTGRLIVLLVVLLLALTAAGSIVAQFTTPVLRLLEGYWPRAFHRLARRLTARAWERRKAAVETIRTLTKSVDNHTATDPQLREFNRAEAVRRAIPAEERLVLPTRLGNRLRAAETRSWERYRLDAVTVWPSLWLTLPETTRAALTAARLRLQATTTGLLWCVLLLLWTTLTWWAAPVALGATLIAHRWWVIPAAVAFGELLEATFHDHRFELYKALRLPPPANAGEEHAHGITLTRYLARGRDDARLVFDHPKDTPPAT